MKCIKKNEVYLAKWIKLKSSRVKTTKGVKEKSLLKYKENKYNYIKRNQF